MDLKFQAIGILRGLVARKKGRLSIHLYHETFLLVPSPEHPELYSTLWTRVESRSETLSLVLCPVFTFSRRDELPDVSFQLLDIDPKQGIIRETLSDGEFLIAGVWNYIDKSRLPVISVYHNDVIQEDPEHRFPLHFSVFWINPYVPPHRRRGKRSRIYFVQITTIFDPFDRSFTFMGLLGRPTPEIPPHLEPDRKGSREQALAT